MEEKKLADLIKKHSEFINFPIKLRSFREEEREVVDEEAQAEADAKKADAAAADPNNEDDEVKEEEPAAAEDDKPKMKKIKEKIPEWKHMNDNKAIWTRPKEEIEDPEYV